MSDDEMCQFCLQTITDNVFYDNINTIVNLFFPHKNNLSAGTSVCQSCLNNLESTYNFMTAVNGNNSKILDATIENDNEVCQTCLNPVNNPNIYLYDHAENIAPFSVISKMLKLCLIKLDLAFRQNPIMCNSCWNILKMSFRFLVLCNQIDKKITQYCVEHHIKSPSVAYLKKLRKSIPNMTTVPHFDRCPNIITSHRTLSDDIFTDIKVEMEEGQALRGGFKVENGLESDVEFIPEDDDYIPESVDAIHFVKVENCESTCQLNGGGCENVTEDIRAEEDCDENNTGLDSIDKRLYVKLDKIDAHQEVRNNKKDQVSYERKTLYKCPHCSYISCKKYTYTHHLTTHMTLAECASKNMLFQCNLCNYKSKRKYGLTQHMRRIHETIKPKNELIKSQTNKLPANKFSKIIFKCSHCEFETRLFTSLEKHSVSHKNTRTNKIYKCEVCGYEVKKLSGISRHVVTHSKSKKLRCNLCRYKTNRKDSLVQHLKKHKECAKKEEV